jgi:lipooligosaccharide transport system permease protein
VSVTTLHRVLPPALLGGGRASRVVERNVMAYRHGWVVVASGALEPLFYLLGVRVGIGRLVGTVPGPGGRVVGYISFVAPALLASSAMNGVMYDTTFNFFFKLRYSKTFDSMLVTPLGVNDVALGELSWALIRSSIQSVLFLLVMAAMGLLESAWAVLALPVAVLIGFGFGGLGLAVTTHITSWVDFDKIMLAVVPMFLFSATFYPLSSYAEPLRLVVQVTPLYHGVALLRSLCLGDVSTAAAGHAAYLAVMGTVGLAYASRRMKLLLLH